MYRPLGKSTVFALMALVSLAGCDREWSVSPKSGEVSSRGTPVAGGGESEASLQEPSAAIAHWRQWRDRKQYRLLRPHIDPDDRAVFLDTLVGADLVLDANQRACQAIAGVLGEHRVELWDLSSLGGDLGLFSNDLKIIQVERNGNQATVTFQVGERLPLETAHLRLGPQGWVYFPGTGPYELPGMLRDLAVTLSDIAEMVRRDRPSVARIDQEYRLRVFPRLLALQRVGSSMSDRGA
jgi:hypothetical protein